MTLTERYLAAKDWPASRKVMAFGVVLLAWHAGTYFRWGEITDQVNAPLASILRDHAWTWAAATLVCGVVGGMGYWCGHVYRWLPHVLAVVYGYFIVEYVHISWSTLALTWIPLASLLFAFFFDERVGATLLVTSLAWMVGGDLLGRVDLAPPPIGSLVDATSDKLTQSLTSLLVIVNFVYCAFALSAQRLLEQRVLAANRLIRRYVPAQLADRILVGGHDENAAHERRKLTIFFSDVAGFTNLSDEQDAEELAAVLNEYLSEMTLIADRHEATINQLVGDGIMIFFGAPIATNDRDHALRAVRMSCEMQRRMVELRDAWFKRGIQRPFHVRIGINTGFASVGDFGSPGRMMYSAIGQQTNLAARIQSQCEPDRILLSHATWALVKDEIPCIPKGEIMVKGLHYPVLVYEVSDAATQSAA